MMSQHINSFREYTLICPCGKTNTGIGLIFHLEKKERWYRLHQKKCDICRPVRFHELESVCNTDNFLTGAQKDHRTILNAKDVERLFGLR